MRCCIWIAWITGVFSFTLACLLLFNSIRLYQGSGNGKVRLVEAQELAPLKKQLRENPKNEGLKLQIRTLDQQLRSDYFRRGRLGGRAGWMLLAGSLVFLTSLQLAVLLGKSAQPAILPISRSADTSRTSATAARAVAGTTLGLAGLATALFWDVSPRWQNLTPAANQTTATATLSAVGVDPDWYPTDVETAANWPYFRGPDGSGITQFPSLPQSWDAAAGTSLLWKSEIPLPGENSPVVWGDRVFLTGSNETHREVYCYDTASGKLLWKQAVGTPQSAAAEAPEVMEDTGFAAPTAATDGKRVFAMFANGDIAAISAEGRPLWTKSLGTPENVYGHASSLLLWHNRVIVLVDQGDADSKKSKIMALDSNTGAIAWSTPRPVPNSWASPILIRHGDRQQIITTADPWVIAYNPATGKELWRADCMSGDVATSPVYANDLIYVASDQSCVAAIKPDGSGDVTETHIVWKNDETGLPDTCSMFCDGPRVYTLVFGVFHAFDSLTGKHLWAHETDIKFEASPSLASGRIYLLSNEGVMIIGTADNHGFKETGRGSIEDETGASPAFAPGRIYLRGNKYLFCIGNKDGK